MTDQADNHTATCAKEVRTTCPYCGVGCGIIATRDAAGHVEVKGDPDHPANFGRLCSKGSALAETLSLEGRLLHPHINGQRADWDTALDLIASTFADTIRGHGPDAVAFYVSGQILTEDYYVANKLMKGFIGSGNIDTNSRLCMASSVAGHKRAFGSDTVPGTYEDFELADLVVLVGSNLAWCHPVLFQRLAAAREARGTKIVVIDPRATSTCEIADMHLAIAPGSDVALFNGLLASIANSSALDRAYVEAHTVGFDDALQQASASSVAQVARETGLSQGEIERFYKLVVSTPRALTIYSQGVNQSSAGTDKVNAIINCHLATGRIGKPGMGPFSVTGQPNAMGGRETGGLANMLAAHMEFGNADHRRIVSEFWRAPALASQPGLKAVDMFRAVRDGRIKAIWIMATNPASSMPETGLVKEALSQCPFVVVSDMTADTDTAKFAHVLLPSTAWGEKDGTVTNSERRISRQRAFLDAPGEARADWRQMAEIGRRMGYADEFGWREAFEIFAEYSELTGIENNGVRDLDLSAHAGIGSEAYETLASFQWPQARGRKPGETRFFANGEFFTPDRKARFVSVTARKPLPASADYPLVLNTGRIRDQWHTMTRSAKSPRLMQHIAEPFLEVHPDDAAQFGLETAGLARVASPHGEAILRVLVNERVRRGEVFAPMHWSGSHAGASGIGALIASNVDPVSGQPELKYTPVMASSFEAQWYGFAVLSERPETLDADYWAIARTYGGWRIELADSKTPEDWSAFAQFLLARCGEGDMIAYSDHISGQHRFALLAEGQLLGAFFVSRKPVEVSRNWLVSQLAASDLPANAGLRLLAGRAGGAEKDKGAIVCSCFDVGHNEIAGAVVGGCTSVEAVGAALKAGTNCGSCRSEISRILRTTPAQDVAREAV